MIQVGCFSIEADHPSLPGHFPGNPVVPGAVLLDHAFSLIFDNEPDRGTAGIPRVKFLTPVRAGQVVTVMADRKPDGRALRFRCLVNGETVAEGSLAPI